MSLRYSQEETAKPANGFVGVKPCPNCGGPLLDGKCDFCHSDEQKKLIDRALGGGEKCVNCHAPLTTAKEYTKFETKHMRVNGVEADYQIRTEGRLKCAYCGWLIRALSPWEMGNPVEDSEQAPSSGSGKDIKEIITAVIMLAITFPIILTVGQALPGQDAAQIQTALANSSGLLGIILFMAMTGIFLKVVTKI